MEAEGHRDAAPLCLFKKKKKNWRQVNAENKWRWWRRTKNEEVVIKGSRIALAAVSPYYQCKVFMQILCRCVSGLWSSKSGTLEHMPALECNLERLSCLRQREKGGVGRREEHEGEGKKKVGQTDPLFFQSVPSFSPCSVICFSLPLSAVIGGGWQVLVPTQFLSHMQKNGLCFPFIPYPSQQAGLLVYAAWYRETFKRSSQTWHNAAGWN